MYWKNVEMGIVERWLGGQLAWFSKDRKFAVLFPIEETNWILDYYE